MPEVQTILKGDIVQITNEQNAWYPCLLIVDEVKSWGIQGYATIPSPDGKTTLAYYRVSYNEIERIGTAKVLSEPDLS